MQQRRGTSEQWTLANPILAPGEIGFETDENRFKIGDGTNRWNTLPYFTNSESLPEIDLSGYATIEDLEGYATTEALADAIAAIPAPDYTGLATETYVGTAVSTAIGNLVDTAPAALDTLNELAAALNDDANFATTVTDAIAEKQDKVTDVSDTEIGYLVGVTSNIQDQLDSKALSSDLEDISSQLDNLSNSQDPQFLSGSGVGTEPLYTLTDPANFVGNYGLLPPGAANWHYIIPPTSASADINALGLAEDNFTVVISGTSTVYDGTWDGFRVQSSPTLIRFYGPTDAPQTLFDNGFTFELRSGVSQKTISSVEIRQLDGLKGSVQGQLDATQRIMDTRLGDKANIESPTFTGLVSGNASAASTAANGAKALGFKGIPLSNAGAAGAYTITASDAGEMIYTTTSRTVTIPATASVPFEIGTSIVFISGAGATTTIGITADNLILAGPGTTGSRTLAPHGMATAVKVAATTWYISGNGLT